MSSAEGVRLAEIVSNLRKTFLSGKTKSYQWRIDQLNAVLRFLKENEKRLIEALAADLGRHKFEAIGLEVVPIVSDIEHIKANLKSWMTPKQTPIPALMQPATSEIQHEPYGVCLILGAFNYPVDLTLGPLVGAICAGNCALIKPSEMSSAVEKLMDELLPAYLDTDAFTVVCGGVQTTTEILKQRFDKIFFTGSPRVGKIVMKAAAENLTPCSLELGGKSPTIIDESVTDMDLVTQRILWGKCANAGQTCIAPDYIFCHEKHYDTFVAAAQRKIAQFYGTDVQKTPFFARIITKAHCERLKGLIEEKGAHRVAIGGKVDVDNKYVEPTILVDVKLDSKVMAEEIFGPVLPVVKYTDINQCISYINKNEKPLTMYIFGKNRRTIDRLIKEVSSGSVVVNDCLFQFANFFAPFGGVGHSGMGGYHGWYSFECFSHKKPVMRRDDHKILDVPQRYPPYSDLNLKIFRAAAKLPTLPVVSLDGIKNTLFLASLIGIGIAIGHYFL